MTCPCADARPQAGVPPLEVLAGVRECCPALLQLFLPADVWETVVAKENGPPDPARHASSLLLAFEQGALSRLTGPVHRFLMEDGHLRSDLSLQYRQDLQERWLSAPTGVKRHERARLFFGKVVELQVASWLDKKGWAVKSLEALGGSTDVIAESPARETCSFEIKYIGWQTDEFLGVVETLAGGDVGGAIPTLQGVPLFFLDAANYLLFRVYEAARRLQQRCPRRIAAVVVDAMSWRRFATPLDERWIRWNAPVFLMASDQWSAFLANQRQHIPTLDTELPVAISALNHLWVFKYAEYDCVLEHQTSLATSA